MFLLIDGDQYLQRCCAATERETKWDEDNWVLASNEEEAWETLTASLGGIFDHFGTKEHVIALGRSPYFRHELFSGYKAGRGRKPLAFYAVRERLKAEYKTREVPGLEADDVMGILATKPGADAIIVARDKDMKTIPGKHWDGMTFERITEAGADYWHMFQTLVGDPTDGFKGCPGVGPKKAEGILAGSDNTTVLWLRVVDAFEKANLTSDDALLQARLARILRWSDWDSERKEPILWTP